VARDSFPRCESRLRAWPALRSGPCGPACRGQPSAGPCRSSSREAPIPPNPSANRPDTRRGAAGERIGLKRHPIPIRESSQDPSAREGKWTREGGSFLRGRGIGAERGFTVDEMPGTLCRTALGPRARGPLAERAAAPAGAVRSLSVPDAFFV